MRQRQDSALAVDLENQHEDTLGQGLLSENIFFARFASMLPTGLAILDHNAEAIFVNPQFHDLTLHKDDDKSFRAWPRTIHSNDYDRVMAAYRDAFDKQQPLRIEFRAQGASEQWRLLLLSPLKGDDLKHAELKEYGGFVCAIIDITSNKMAELAQQKAAKEAQESKEHLERFIDMISHEVRNPLSAVLHSAEDIEEALRQPMLTLEARNQISEATEVVKLCVAHQKAIVDDVLAFSKLGASMLKLAPRVVRPKSQLVNTVKMYQPELRKHSISLVINVDRSYEENGIDWVLADLVRMSQVLVNLITNAIKFTAGRPGKRKISITIGASQNRPQSYPSDVVFFSTAERDSILDCTTTEAWGNGDLVHIMVAISDTGIGISDEQQRKLFQRFQQATPLTEGVYGGSGLGLNISRKLCHLHGGEVGVSSTEGQGSTFAFFFKARHTAMAGEAGDANMGSAELDKKLHEIDAQSLLMSDRSRQRSPRSSKELPSNISRLDYWKHTEALDTGKRHTDLRNTDCSDKSHNDEDQRPAIQSRILLVEDNVINARVLRRKLETDGFSVVTASNGREAVNTIQASMGRHPCLLSFDLVLMDQEMPVMNGNAASEAIRNLEASSRTASSGSCERGDRAAGSEVEHSNRPHVPILGVSANMRAEQKEEMLAAGMDDVIGKPYAFRELSRRIRTMLMAPQDQ